ncbi:hypothetical protein HID58_065778 [Brassica napus]|uniref:Uncharacterized protein n=1 Tax=Brassica napus TaxID=3708 RepID=A0ABQ7ZDT4_BRANA|nr:hypothetical protein HID58_065778 [Brassica napus]
MDVIGISGEFLLYLSVILRLKNLKFIGQITSSPTLTNLLRDMAIIRREIGNKVLKTSVSGLVELNILKNFSVYVVAGSLGRFKSHASNIVFDFDEECAAADPPEISDAQNNRKRCRE